MVCVVFSPPIHIMNLLPVSLSHVTSIHSPVCQLHCRSSCLQSLFPCRLFLSPSLLMVCTG